MRVTAGAVSMAVVAAAFAPPVAAAGPSSPGVVNYAVLGKGSVGNIVGGPMRAESMFTEPFQAYWVDDPVCNNWADIGLPEVYDDPDLASFAGATTQTSPTDQNHLVKQAVGVFATGAAADRAFHRVVDRTVGCSGQTTAIHLDNGTTQVWSFAGGPPSATDETWTKQEVGTDRRCFTQTRVLDNVLLQAKVCQPGNGGLALNVLVGAMENALGQ
ncbi:sensor domain-containing protein [Mycobacterium sp.]|uniref:sensor domain-containing protein n=1 Tax=Mycobacterium sp. TaxID=1785 RepID=UPI00126DFDB7|nr:sensor domain-containing protein [Mycobacterium sp.]KAA8959069.1 MAG: sensor domain-containing protein [Mycobacterium sp.]